MITRNVSYANKTREYTTNLKFSVTFRVINKAGLMEHSKDVWVGFQLDSDWNIRSSSRLAHKAYIRLD